MVLVVFMREVVEFVLFYLTCWNNVLIEAQIETKSSFDLPVELELVLIYVKN